MATLPKCPYTMMSESGGPLTPPDYPLREGLREPPALMAHLPRDRRGYPVPFFVAWPGDEPEFRASSKQVIEICVNRKLCWVCGRPLDGQKTFVIGPMCTINRISSEPPTHRDCARYSATSCPFLTKPQMVRREADMPEGIVDGAGVMLRHNPGVTALWFARGFEVVRFPEGRLWHFTEKPAGMEWYCLGRKGDAGGGLGGDRPRLAQTA